MNELALLLLVVIALAIGWGLGRRERRQCSADVDGDVEPTKDLREPMTVGLPKLVANVSRHTGLNAA